MVKSGVYFTKKQCRVVLLTLVMLTLTYSVLKGVFDDQSYRNVVARLSPDGKRMKPRGPQAADLFAGGSRRNGAVGSDTQKPSFDAKTPMDSKMNDLPPPAAVAPAAAANGAAGGANLIANGAPNRADQLQPNPQNAALNRADQIQPNPQNAQPKKQQLQQQQQQQLQQQQQQQLQQQQQQQQQQQLQQQQQQSQDQDQESFVPADEFSRLVNLNPMLLFSKSRCPYSQKLKSLLASEYEFDPQFVVIELDNHKHGTALHDYIKEKTGRRTVPNVIVGGISRGGYDDLKALHSDGLLIESFKKWGEGKVTAKKKLQ